MNIKKGLLFFLSLLICNINVIALDIGLPEVYSALQDPLYAELKLSNSHKRYEIFNSPFSDYKQNNLDYSREIDGIKFDVIKKQDGTYLRIYTYYPIQSSILDLLLNINENGKTYIRQVSLFVMPTIEAIASLPVTKAELEFIEELKSKKVSSLVSSAGPLNISNENKKFDNNVKPKTIVNNAVTDNSDIKDKNIELSKDEIIINKPIVTANSEKEVFIDNFDLQTAKLNSEVAHQINSTKQKEAENKYKVRPDAITSIEEGYGSLIPKRNILTRSNENQIIMGLVAILLITLILFNKSIIGFINKIFTTIRTNSTYDRGFYFEKGKYVTASLNQNRKTAFRFGSIINKLKNSIAYIFIKIKSIFTNILSSVKIGLELIGRVTFNLFLVLKNISEYLPFIRKITINIMNTVKSIYNLISSKLVVNKIKTNFTNRLRSRRKELHDKKYNQNDMKNIYERSANLSNKQDVGMLNISSNVNKIKSEKVDSDIRGNEGSKVFVGEFNPSQFSSTLKSYVSEKNTEIPNYGKTNLSSKYPSVSKDEKLKGEIKSKYDFMKDKSTIQHNDLSKINLYDSINDKGNSDDYSSTTKDFAKDKDIEINKQVKDKKHELDLYKPANEPDNSQVLSFKEKKKSIDTHGIKHKHRNKDSKVAELFDEDNLLNSFDIKDTNNIKEKNNINEVSNNYHENENSEEALLKFDLAKTYADIGKVDNAYSLLSEVIIIADDDLKQQARDLLEVLHKNSI